MTDPLIYTSATPRHSLPLLFVGQAQKEASVNDAHALADILLHPSVEGELADPPADPADGQCWLVGTGASGAFEGREQCLASYQAGTWVFAKPCDGMVIFDRQTSQFLPYLGGWQRETAPAQPQGGDVVDVEARATIATLVELLSRMGILPPE
ncbi:hypothetical protein GCM10011515_22020 [Tsuneonella deserti]|uniref:DUF2793 domain-containing protein n=1 Tax=Tsuneonella deserti TaxID=2035528 RepID=A0ABQ1S9V7_9SPHN|nr:DUF2793 domain-containing protein [Tsuneonella deserti]GGE01940.1 hypothetical protein GCM10011515_22020 [Tsuneonella deserti]